MTTAYDAQRAEQARIARYVLDTLFKEWDEEVAWKMLSDEWLTRVLDSYDPTIDLVKAEAELVPAERTLQSLIVSDNGRAMHTALQDRIRATLKYMRGEQ